MPGAPGDARARSVGEKQRGEHDVPEIVYHGGKHGVAGGVSGAAQVRTTGIDGLGAREVEAFLILEHELAQVNRGPRRRGKKCLAHHNKHFSPHSIKRRGNSASG